MEGSRQLVRPREIPPKQLKGLKSISAFAVYRMRHEV
jgi:hypothetical protein